MPVGLPATAGTAAVSIIAASAVTAIIPSFLMTPSSQRFGLRW
jgi:hypothetical protein